MEPSTAEPTRPAHWLLDNVRLLRSALSEARMKLAGAVGVVDMSASQVQR